MSVQDYSYFLKQNPVDTADPVSTFERTLEQDNDRLTKVFRKKFNINPKLVEDITFKIAESVDELEQSFRLVYETYLEKGYTNPHPSRMLPTFYHTQPDTTVFIGIHNNQVITTMSVVPDSPFGLAIDKMYHSELLFLRHQGRKIGELCSLATHKNFRSNNQTLPLFLIKLMYEYARDTLRIDNLVISVNPKHSLFYESILCFDKIGGLRNCEHVKNNPAYAYSGDLQKLPSVYKNIYKGLPENRDLHHFFIQYSPENIQLPPQNKEPLYVWNRDKLRYFFEQKTNLFEELDEDRFHYIMGQHERYMEESLMELTA